MGLLKRITRWLKKRNFIKEVEKYNGMKAIDAARIMMKKGWGRKIEIPPYENQTLSINRIALLILEVRLKLYQERY